MKYSLLLLLATQMIFAMEQNGTHDTKEQILKCVQLNQNKLDQIVQLLRSHSLESNQEEQIYTPWRSTYDKSKSSLVPLSSTHCPFCEKISKNPDELDENDQDKYFVVQQFDHGTTYVLNQNPYMEGHSMLIPQEHIENWTKLSSQQMLEWMKVRTWGIALLQKLYSEHFNTFVNGGKIGGQSVMHIHEQLLPRRNEGALNLIGKVHIVSEWLATTHKKLKKPLSILQKKLHDGEDEINVESLFEDEPTK